MNRRRFLRQTAAGLAVTVATAGSGAGIACRTAVSRGPAARRLPCPDARLLDELGRASLSFFLERAHPETGQVLDRARADGEVDSRGVGSIAATGYGLAAWCLGAERGWISDGEARARVRRALRHLRYGMGHERGFFYHFHDWSNGRRIWNCELSSIDTAILLCGVLTARARYGDDPEIRGWATELYERVDWPWMLDGGETLSMGWLPEKGFLASRWDHYSELMLLYLLALGSPTHPLPARCWRAWSRPVREYYGQRYVWSPAPLFVHQFSHAWFDFRRQPDAGVDWFANSVAATRAHLAWSLDRSDRFPEWSRDLWGVTSSDSERGYVAWGGPPDSGPLDGTIVPCAAAGSLPFLPEACLRTLRHQRDRYGDRIWKRHGWVDAFHPGTGWVNPDVVGIDVGITILMAENLRSGFVWRVLGGDADLRRGWGRAGLGASGVQGSPGERTNSGLGRDGWEGSGTGADRGVRRLDPGRSMLSDFHPV